MICPRAQHVTRRSSFRRRRESHASRGMRAVILPVVLFILLLLGLLVATFALRIHADEAAMRAAALRTQTRLAAEAGVEKMKLFLRVGRFDRDLWYDNVDEMHRIIVWAERADKTVLGSHDKLRDDVMAFRYSIVADDPMDDEDFVRFGITDENSKLNLNTATPAQLLRLVEQSLAEEQQEEISPQDIVDAIIDWRDPDSNPAGAADDTEGVYYKELQRPYRPRNGPFESVEELLLVKGVTPDLLYGEDVDRNGLLSENEDDGDNLYPQDNADGKLNRGLYPYLTVFARDKNVANNNRPRANLKGDANAARAELTLAFPDDPEVVDYVIQAARGPTGGQPGGRRGGVPSGGAPSGGKPGEAGAGANQPPQPGAPGGSQPVQPNPRPKVERKPGTRTPVGSPAPNSGSNPRQPRQNERKERSKLEAQQQSRQPRPGQPAGGRPGSNTGGRPNRPGTNPPGGKPGAGEQPTGEPPPGDSQQPPGGSGEQGEGTTGEPSTGEPSSGNPPTGGGPNDGGTSQQPMKSPADLFREPANGGSSPLKLEHLATLMDRTTFVAAEELPGLINVNTADPVVLRCIDGLTEEQIQAIVSTRDSVSAEALATPAWLVTEGVLDMATFQQIAPAITARGTQFTIESLGYADHVGTVTRLQVVVDMLGPIPQTIYYRDITNLGGSFPIREEFERQQRGR